MSGPALRVLILGGYGTFGGRLAHLLRDDSRVELIIAGRSRRKAEAFCAALGGTAACRPEAFDRDGDVAARLAELKPAVLVDASGPFQDYGEDPYRVVRACVGLKVAYLDLADGAAFVDGVAAFEAEARAANVAVLSGVSTLPVLSAAVVRRLAGDMAEIDEVAGGIAPSPFAGVGLNVIRAIAGYAGRPIEVRRGGVLARAHGLTETMRYTIRPPGRVPLPSILFSLVDAPDTHALPALWPGLRTVWMGAGPRPEVLHRMLIGLAWLRRLKLLPSLEPMSPLFHWATNAFRWGEHRGGMFVRVRGLRADGVGIERSWHLQAEGDDGPLIPSMAAAALIGRALDGRCPEPGARAGTCELELEDYEALFARRAIHTGVREAIAGAPRGPLYQRHLGSAWDALPGPIRALHDIGGGRVAEGRAEVVRGGGSCRGWRRR
jgi:saccharopine dehydrogenase-like protein